MNMVSSHSAPDCFRLVSRRNESLGSKGRRRLFAGIAVVSLAIALGWSLRGAWVVLPFAMLEVSILYAVLRAIDHGVQDFESITIDGDRVLVERREHGRVSRYEFNKYWAQVVIKRSDRWGRVDLAVRSHGKEVGFGQFLTDEERVSLARELLKRLKHY